MKTIRVPIGEARTDLCKLVRDVSSRRVRVLLTRHGKPKAEIVAFEEHGARWRVETPDDPSGYGNLQSPVMEDWQ